MTPDPLRALIAEARGWERDANSQNKLVKAARYKRLADALDEMLRQSLITEAAAKLKDARDCFAGEGDYAIPATTLLKLDTLTARVARLERAVAQLGVMTGWCGDGDYQGPLGEIAREVSDGNVAGGEHE